MPAVGHPAFGDLGARRRDQLHRTSRAASGGRSTSRFPEYQRTGQDFLAAWSVQGGGQLRPGYPQTVNDLQFLTGPSVADIDGLPGEEIVEGSASKDLAAFSAAGTPVNQRWPKASTDWTVANPTIGSFGSLETDSGARKIVIALTRSGYIDAYSTDAPACSPGSWPRFHHDPPTRVTSTATRRCPASRSRSGSARPRWASPRPATTSCAGPPAGYEIATSASPIDESNFAAATTLGGAPAPAPAGTRRSYPIPSDTQRYLAVRAVDEQGNVGRVSSVDLGPGAGGGGGGGGSGGGGGGGGGLANGPCANPKKGGRGRDVLVGTPKGDRLFGYRGADRLIGRAGRDCLKGGKGNDRIRARDGQHDVVRCGAGRHDVAIVDRRDRVRGCERVRRR